MPSPISCTPPLAYSAKDHTQPQIARLHPPPPGKSIIHRCLAARSRARPFIPRRAAGAGAGGAGGGVAFDSCYLSDRRGLAGKATWYKGCARRGSAGACARAAAAPASALAASGDGPAAAAVGLRPRGPSIGRLQPRRVLVPASANCCRVCEVQSRRRDARTQGEVAERGATAASIPGVPGEPELLVNRGLLSPR